MTFSYSLFSVLLYRRMLYKFDRTLRFVILALKFITAKSFFGVLSSYSLIEIYPERITAL